MTNKFRYKIFHALNKIGMSMYIYDIVKELKLINMYFTFIECSINFTFKPL